MGRQLTWSPGACVRAWEPVGILSHAPLEDRPLDARREPAALEGWSYEVRYCDPKS